MSETQRLLETAKRLHRFNLGIPLERIHIDLVKARLDYLAFSGENVRKPRKGQFSYLDTV